MGSTPLPHPGPPSSFSMPLRLAAVRMPGQFSGSRKCNHGIFPRLSAPLGAAPSQDIINGARNAAAAAIVICCSGNKQTREREAAAVTALLSQPSHVIGLVQNQGTPVHTTPHRPTHSVHGFPRPLRFRLMSCLLPIRPHRTGFKASSCCTAGEERCVSSFASIRWTLCILLPADLSSLTPPFFPRWLGKFDTRARRHFIESRKEKGDKISRRGWASARKKITEMEIPSSL